MKDLSPVSSKHIGFLFKKMPLNGEQEGDEREPLQYK